jgi:hypothetical protein
MEEGFKDFRFSKIWWLYKKVCCYKKLIVREKVVFLLNENNSRALLPPSKLKGKEKWQEIVWGAKLFVQKMRTAARRRPCTGLQRQPFISGKTHII